MRMASLNIQFPCWIFWLGIRKCRVGIVFFYNTLINNKIDVFKTEIEIANSDFEVVIGNPDESRFYIISVEHIIFNL